MELQHGPDWGLGCGFILFTALLIFILIVAR